MKIKQLPDALANKIAAGEVVERPASVVKELVENSVDANSTWIKIELKEAGLELISITDNGEGMSSADCEAAFLRHATSKITNEHDLFRVSTLGFRGEALASIASVSKLRLRTSTGDHAGTELYLEGGKVISREKSSARQGTEISVEHLFFNTPARLKYMKTIHTELGHITDILNRVAIAHPNIRFEVFHNDRLLFQTTGSGDLLQVIAKIYGMNVARKMIPIKKRTLDYSISGFIAKPEITRASRSFISTIVNGRYIRSQLLNQAILRAYHTLLPINRFPIVVLNIEMDPILVDVNVHPSKLEVRFSKEKELFQLIEETVKEKLTKTTLIPTMERKQPKKQNVQSAISFNYEHDNRKNGSSEANEQKQNIHETALDHGDVPDDDSHLFGNTIKEPFSSLEEQSSSPLEMQSHSDSLNQSEQIPIIYPVGQVQGTYIVGQNENGLYLIDQHAAQERIKYEYFKEKLGTPEKELQSLLIPLHFEFTRQETFVIGRYKNELEMIGLSFDHFGEQSYVIRAYPTWFPDGLEEDIVREMINQLMHDKKVDIEKLREDMAILMACKRSIKANHYLNQAEMTSLLSQLQRTNNPYTCPHGRPIIIHFSSYELEKMFKRVM